MNRLWLLLLLPALAWSAGCSTNPATGDSQLLLIDQQTEIAMGVDAMPQLIAEYGGESDSAALRSYITSTGDKLAANVEDAYRSLPWEFTVLRSDVINAFALPGGKVFITEGLLARFENEAQVAGVLGHEIGHVTGRHVGERISQTMIAQVGAAAAGAMTESALLQYSADLFAQGYVLKFGRDQESQADQLGVRYMTRASYSPMGMIQVLQVLDEAAQGPRQPEFLSTHPHPQTRLRTVNGLLEGEYRYTLDNPDFGLYPNRFQQYARPYLPALAATTSEDHLAWCGVCRAAEHAHAPTDNHTSTAD